MTYTATISQKRQFTIPAALFRKLGLREGQKLTISEEAGGLKLTSMLQLVKDTAGSVVLPKRFRDLSVENVKTRAIKEYFSSKHDVR